MIPQNVYNQRINDFCSKCELWSRLQCRKGHLPTSPTGCPVHKFEPINGAGYDEDRLADPVAINMDCCSGGNNEMPDLSWSQVLAMFAQSMVRWVKGGMALAPEKVHGDRLRKCESCPHRSNFWCSKCKCVCYLKAKVATEQCPDSPPRWLRF